LIGEEDALCRVQLEASFLRRDHPDVGMGIRVVPDLMAFIPDAADQIGIALRVLADQKKCRWYVQRFQLVEDVGCIWAGRSVVDRQRDHLRFVSGPADHVGGRKFVVILVESESCLRIDLQ
jgi:hypothetical protein